MPLEVKPVPELEELAAIAAVLELLAEPTAQAPPPQSRWRAAARAFDGEMDRPR